MGGVTYDSFFSKGTGTYPGYRHLHPRFRKPLLCQTRTTCQDDRDRSNGEKAKIQPRLSNRLHPSREPKILSSATRRHPSRRMVSPERFYTKQNPRMKLPPASFVKVLTLYVAFDAIKAGQLKKRRCGDRERKGLEDTDRRCSLKSPSQVKVDDLLKGIAVVSGNDAGIALRSTWPALRMSLFQK